MLDGAETIDCEDVIGTEMMKSEPIWEDKIPGWWRIRLMTVKEVVSRPLRQ